MDKKTAWFFGDSFTEPLFTPGTRKVNGVVIDKYIPWTNIVCSHFDWIEKNFGCGGTSTERIVRTFIENLSHIKSGDVVIITDSMITRIEGVTQTTYPHDIITFNADSLVDFPNAEEHELPIKKSNFKVFVNYLYDFILKYEDTWEDYWINIIIGLKKELELKNIETYYWSHKLWDVYPNPPLFTTLTTETNSQILNGHWGPLGNRQFAEYMINRIENKEYIRTSEKTLNNLI